MIERTQSFNSLLQRGFSQLGSISPHDRSEADSLRSRSESAEVNNALRGSLMNRLAINCPAPELRHKDYNRYKYYDKLRTSAINSHITGLSD